VGLIDQLFGQLAALNTGPEIIFVEHPPQLGGAHDTDWRYGHAVLD
jgi:hypothetical protein